ncbi:MAG: RHS repeat-associated core domain-containing protein, partial [Brevefilum sp.]|nr:RHS repeat-associated core domain-containing protein [Brevefilum sp.]
LDRILTVTYPTGAPMTVAYSYDPMGNRLTMAQDGVVTSYTYDATDRLVSKTTAGVPTAYTWDDAGNLLTKGGQSFTWNKAGKLATWNGGTTSTAYAYNGDGVRVGYTVAGTTTHYLQDLAWGMALVLREETGSSAIDYLYGLDLIAQGDGVSHSYLMADGLGSTRFLTDENGSVVARYSYDVFGLERSKTGSGETDFTFAGEQMDKDTGLQYLRARYFDPDDGRFISQDLFMGYENQPKTLNRFVYCGNNPSNEIDPLGLDYIYNKISIGAFLGLGAKLEFVYKKDFSGQKQVSYNFEFGGGWGADISVSTGYEKGNITSDPGLSSVIKTFSVEHETDLLNKSDPKGSIELYFLKLKKDGISIKPYKYSFWPSIPIRGTFKVSNIELLRWKTSSKSITTYGVGGGGGGSGGGSWGTAPSRGK